MPKKANGTFGGAKRPRVPERAGAAFGGSKTGKARPAGENGKRSFAPDRAKVTGDGAKRTYAPDGAKRSFTPDRSRVTGDGAKRTYAPDAAKRPFTPDRSRVTGDGAKRTYAPDGAKRSFTPDRSRATGDGAKRTYAPDAAKRPFTPDRSRVTGDGAKRTYAPDGAKRSFTPDRSRVTGDGAKRTYAPDGAKRSFTPDRSRVTGDGAKRTYAPDAAKRPFTPDRSRATGDGEKRFFTPDRSDGDKRPYTPERSRATGDGEKRVFAPGRSNFRREGTPAPERIRTNARDVALRALQDVAANGAYAAQALDRQLEGVHLLPDDRRLATSIFYAAVENRIRVSHILKAFVKTTLPEIYDVLHIACAQLLYLDKVPDHAAVDEAVKQARALKGQHVMGFVNGVLRNVIRARDAGELLTPEEGEDAVSAGVEHSVSEELMEKLTAAFGAEEAGNIASYLPAKRTQTIRPNLMTTTDEELGTYLTARNVQWKAGIVPHAFICQNPGALASLDGYRQGIFSIQGEGSMLATLAVGAKPGMTILDACAAPGGKSALLCEMMNGTGRVYAWDVHEHRMELIRAAGRRLRLYNLRPMVRDARAPYEEFEAFLDAVLVDAPCSGLGVLADKPDIRIKFKSADVDDLIKLQREILQNCAKLVKVGGLLVYSTCTILPEENEKQVRDFLAHNPQFALEEDAGYLPEKLRSRAKDGMIQMFQHLDGVEGFFIARMRRRCL